MFTTKFKIRLSLAISALIAVSTASAHPSGHAEINTSQLLEHMFASPFHTGIIAIGVIAVALAVGAIYKQKTSKATKLK